MECELCGEQISRGNKTKVEGSIVVACDKCSRLGEVIQEVEQKKPEPPRKSVEKSVEGKRVDFSLGFREELIDDYGVAVRKARESRDMKQEELAKKINEPESVVKKIESMKMEPNNKIARKIENILNIRLFTRTLDEESKLPDMENSVDATLGDVMVIRKK